MDQIKAHCPRCEKLYRVQTAELYEGEPQFECQACQTQFAFRWPQPPGVTDYVATYLVVTPAPPQLKESSAPIESLPKVSPVAQSKRPKRTVDTSRLDISPPNEGIRSAWEAVKANYDDENRHEAFIQFCLQKNALPFASHVYRQLLLVMPSDALAQKMQSRIVDLVTSTYLVHSFTKQKKPSTGWGALTIFFVMGVLLIIAGIVLDQFRALIAAGAAILVFGSVLRSMRRSI